MSEATRKHKLIVGQKTYVDLTQQKTPVSLLLYCAIIFIIVCSKCLASHHSSANIVKLWIAVKREF